MTTTPQSDTSTDTQPRSTRAARERKRATILRAIFRGIWLGLVVAAVMAIVSGCVSVAGIYPSTETGATNETGDNSTGSDDSGTDSGGDQGSSDSDAPGDVDPAVSGTRPDATDEPFFRVTEDYWVQTPWFGVSSIIVMIRRTAPPTQIVVPPESLLTSVMRPVDNVVPVLPADHRRDRIRININFHMGDVPPFVDPQRYANPEAYQ